jgi:hypothetical protein
MLVPPSLDSICVASVLVEKLFDEGLEITSMTIVTYVSGTDTELELAPEVADETTTLLKGDT